MTESLLIYTQDILETYDRERHVPLSDAYSFLERPENELSSAPLQQAINANAIKVYEFNGNQYLDRLDIGRIFHKNPKNKIGINIERYFTKEGKDPVNTIDPLQKKHLTIYGDKGIVFEMEDAYFPKFWDDNSASIVAQKYFFKPHKEEWKKKLKNKLGVEYENSVVHLDMRIANFFADKGEELGYFATPSDKQAFKDELLWLQLHRKGAFNSPVQFNAGLYNEYGIKGERGINYVRDPKTGKVQRFKDGEYVFPQCHACFIKGPRDDLESIAMHVVDETGIFALGSGIGQDIGALRAEGEILSGGGKASGPMSFFKTYDGNAGQIKSGGKTRRAARMTTMRQDHPDIMKFIRGKLAEDHKALTLMKAGYSKGMDGEAYTTVAYQNTNLSVRLDDHFFDQLEKGGSIELHTVTDRKVIGKISAEQILKEMAFGSWRIGDPGIQYESKIQEMHTCKNSGRQNSTNPCGEYLFLNDTSCNLASLNLVSFADQGGNFDVQSFEKAVRIFAIAQDIANDAASYPVRDIAMISPEFRTIGTGYANLGSLLMRRGLAYDSNEGRAIAAAISAVLTGTVYETSTELAEKLGTFDHFEINKKPMLEVMRRHQNSLENIAWDLVPEADLKIAAFNSWNNVLKRGEEFGYRNAQASVLAPTGTIIYRMDGEGTTGGEPPISLIIYKNLAGGGTLRLANGEVQNALRNLGYKEKEIMDISSFISENNKVIGSPHLNPDHYSIFATAFGNKHGEGSISLEGHMKMMGAIQPFISGGISKTNNVPEFANVKQIYGGFLLGYELGLKGVTIFRTNSKPISALDFGAQNHSELTRGKKEDMSNMRNAYESEVTINGTNMHIIVSEFEDGRPGQVTFLSYKAGSTLGALLTTSGVQASRALKRGVFLEDVAQGWLGHEFDPHGLVKGHPHIKHATSPLDYAAKFLLLEYMGRVDLASEPEKVKVEELRGFKNGAIEVFERMDVDDWDFKQVINHPRLGGFTETVQSAVSKAIDHEGNKKLKNERGLPCITCGKIMTQTAPNCYSCFNCGDKFGGCGL